MFTGAVAIGWDGSLVPSWEPGHQADEADWSTYAFEVVVNEYPDGDRPADATDVFRLRWPYCLGDGGHNVWTVESDDGTKDLRCSYNLSDRAAAGKCPNAEPTESVTLIGVDSALSEVSSLAVQPQIGVAYGGTDGLTVYSDPELDGIWRVIFTGEDGCWREYRRDHQNSRMLAFNKATPICPDIWKLIREIRKLENLQYLPLSSIDEGADKNIDNALKAAQIIRAINGQATGRYVDWKWGYTAGALPLMTSNGHDYVYYYGSPDDVVEVEGFFSAFTQIAVPKHSRYDRGALMDGPHFNASLNAHIYNHGPLPMGSDGLLHLQFYSTDQVNECATWGGDMQQSIGSMTQIMNGHPDRMSDVDIYAKQIVGASTPVSVLGGYGYFSHTNMIADIDACNIGAKIGVISGEAPGTLLSSALYSYYTTAATTRFSTFCNKFTDFGDGSLEAHAHFLAHMVSVWPMGWVDHPLITQYSIGMPTGPERTAVENAFVNYVGSR